MNYTILTFGCQMNVSDSERIHTTLKQAGLTHVLELEDADVIIMNTCSVKQKAEDKVWGQLAKAAKNRKKNPRVRVGFTGCMVRESGVHKKYGDTLVSKDRLFQSSDDLDFVFRIEDLQMIPKYLSVLYGTSVGEDYSDELESYFQVRPDYAKSFQVFVPVQTGCDKFCTYCIVPFTRKRELCRPPREILEEVQDLIAKGAKEVTLLGQTVNSYRHSESTTIYSTNNFVELLYHINEMPGIERIRYTSPHPMDMDSELIRAHKELKHLCNHVHLPVQSGDNAVLKRMNRKYTREQFLDIVKNIRAAVPDMCITTDIIVGFCGETEEEFEQTYRLFEEVQFDMSFTSRYSPRKGTYSERRMEDTVSPEEKARRWHRLNELLKQISQEKNNRYVGGIYPVLVERRLEDGRLEGMTTSNKRVQFSAPTPALVGQIIPVKIQRALPFVLLGELLSS